MRPNVINELSKEEILRLVKQNKSAKKVFERLGLASSKSTYYYSQWNAKCKELGLDPTALFRTDAFKRKKVTDDELLSLCAEADSATEVFANLQLSETAGSNFRWINEKCQDLNIDTSHWYEKKRQRIKILHQKQTIPLSQILISNSKYSNSAHLKKRIVKAGLLKYKCAECGISEWRGKKLSLQLEHKMACQMTIG